MSDYHLPPETHIGHAHLQVADLNRSLGFYGDLVGLKTLHRNGGSAALSADGSTPHLLLAERPGARPKPRRSTGLYHVAIRLPDRAALGRLFLHMVQNKYPFGGFSDHLVSEALYLSDLDGNGLELYRDRPRDQWPRVNDTIQMATDPLDPYQLLDEAQQEGRAWNGIDPQTDIGHVHLHVSDLGRAEAFYSDLLGFDVMQRSYAGALFVAAGGYHHHIGLNIWAGQGAPPPPEDAVGLKSFSVVLPTAEAWQALVARVEQAGTPLERAADRHSVTVCDHDRNAVELVVAEL
jgi:catechol 2,3-dioxygenase